MKFQLFFNEEEHKYTDANGNVYISATQFLEKYHADFEDVQDFWLYYKAIQYSSDIDKQSKIKKFDLDLSLKIENYYLKELGKPFLYTEEEGTKLTKLGVWKYKFDFRGFRDLFSETQQIDLDYIVILIKEHWKNENLKSTVRGTAFHNERESEFYNKGFYNRKGKTYTTKSPIIDLHNLEPNSIYPELRLYNEEYRIAGTSDVVIVGENNTIIIEDFKTNIEIKTSNKYAKMFYPIQHLDDCQYVKYSLQLSLYGWMLEQFGYTIEHIEFHHHILNDKNESTECIIYKCPYLKKEIQLMLEHYKETF
jgi:hypothetical protein